MDGGMVLEIVGTPDPQGHLLEHKHTVILGIIEYFWQGRSPEDFCILEVLDSLKDLSYSRMVELFHTMCLQREGQQLLFNDTDVPIMRVPTPPVVQERAVDPLDISEALLNDLLIKDHHLLAALFEFCSCIASSEMPQINKRLFNSYSSSNHRWQLICNLQVTVCLLNSRHCFPGPLTWHPVQEGGTQ
jgi:hypothetical protein